AERPESRLRLALTAATEREPHRGPDPAGEHESDDQRARGSGGQVGAELPTDVGHLADPLAELVDRGREPVPLGLDLQADVRRRSAVTCRHRPSMPPRSAWPPRSPARAPAASPS